MKKLLILTLIVLFGCTIDSGKQASNVTKYNDAYKSTVGIETFTNIMDPFSVPNQGTGVLLDTGFIITARHVLDTDESGVIDATERLAVIEFYYPVAYICTGTVVSEPSSHWMSGKDFVFLSIENPPHSNIHLMSNEDYEEIRAGDDLFAIGKSFAGEPPHITKGIRSTDTTNRIDRASIATYFGNSGGGIFSESTGELVGITTEIQLGMRYEVVPQWTNYISTTTIRNHAESVRLYELVDTRYNFPIWKYFVGNLIMFLLGSYITWVTLDTYWARGVGSARR